MWHRLIIETHTVVMLTFGIRRRNMINNNQYYFNFLFYSIKKSIYFTQTTLKFMYTFKK